MRSSMLLNLTILNVSQHNTMASSKAQAQHIDFGNRFVTKSMKVFLEKTTSSYFERVQQACQTEETLASRCLPGSLAVGELDTTSYPNHPGV